MASEELEKFNKMTNNDLDMSGQKSEIINKLIELYSLRQIYYLNKIENNSKASEKIDNEISKLKKGLENYPKKVVACFLPKKSLQNY